MLLVACSMDKQYLLRLFWLFCKDFSVLSIYVIVDFHFLYNFSLQLITVFKTFADFSMSMSLIQLATSFQLSKYFLNIHTHQKLSIKFSWRTWKLLRNSQRHLTLSKPNYISSKSGKLLSSVISPSPAARVVLGLFLSWNGILLYVVFCLFFFLSRLLPCFG